jgi:hypothetical protein
VAGFFNIKTNQLNWMRKELGEGEWKSNKLINRCKKRKGKDANYSAE